MNTLVSWHGAPIVNPPEITLGLFLSGQIEDSFFFTLPGNYRHLNNIYINSADSEEGAQKELLRIVYNDRGVKMIKQLDSPTKDWTYFIKCGELD